MGRMPPVPEISAGPADADRSGRVDPR